MQQWAREEAHEGKSKLDAKRMTLYKGTLIDEILGDNERQVELANIPFNLKIAKVLWHGSTNSSRGQP